MTTPVITKMEVYPVAGKDCMELNLSGAHAPYFTRNVVVLYADNGEMGVGEVPGGQKDHKGPGGMHSAGGRNEDWLSIKALC